MTKTKNIQKLLATNRSEIAIRVFRAANELGLRTVGIYSQEDRLGLHRFKADEAYQVGVGKGPVEAYLDIAGIVALAAYWILRRRRSSTMARRVSDSAR